MKEPLALPALSVLTEATLTMLPPGRRQVTLTVEFDGKRSSEKPTDEPTVVRVPE
jgi:hypothetical protein